MTKGEYFLLRRANGDARPAATIGGEYDANLTQAQAFDAPPIPTGAEVAARAKAIADSNAVDQFLRDLRASDPAEFNRVRVLPFAEQKTLAGVA